MGVHAKKFGAVVAAAISMGMPAIIAVTMMGKENKRSSVGAVVSGLFGSDESEAKAIKKAAHKPMDEEGLFASLQDAFFEAPKKFLEEQARGAGESVKGNISRCSICDCCDFCTACRTGDPWLALKTAGAKLYYNSKAPQILMWRFQYCKTTAAYREYKNSWSAGRFNRWFNPAEKYGSYMKKRMWAKAYGDNEYQVTGDASSCLMQCGLTYGQYDWLKNNNGVFDDAHYEKKRTCTGAVCGQKGWRYLVDGNYNPDVTDNDAFWTFIGKRQGNLKKYEGVHDGPEKDAA